MKVCTTCGEEKPCSEFKRDSSKKDGLRSCCKGCDKVAYKPNHKRIRRLRHKYNINPEDYNKMYEQQGGVCAICGLEQTASYSEHLNVDHCHRSGAVRGLLCHHCNSGLGQFRDDPRLLNKASAYLMKHLQPLTSDGFP